MKQNSNTILVGKDIILVPYRPEHVETYHEWMKNPFLQETTASEPLTLEQEYEMQKSWSRDPDKCTFIILHRDKNTEITFESIRTTSNMIGDINMFITDPTEAYRGELEIMIAEISERRKGFAIQSIRLFLHYMIHIIKLSTPLTEICVKIGDTNLASIYLFEKLGFQKINHSEIFKEVEMMIKITPDRKQLIMDESGLEKILELKPLI